MMKIVCVAVQWSDEWGKSHLDGHPFAVANHADASAQFDEVKQAYAEQGLPITDHVFFEIDEEMVLRVAHSIEGKDEPRS